VLLHVLLHVQDDAHVSSATKIYAKCDLRARLEEHLDRAEADSKSYGRTNAETQK
jgi:hypothetical protein